MNGVKYLPPGGWYKQKYEANKKSLVTNTGRQRFSLREKHSRYHFADIRRIAFF